MSSGTYLRRCSQSHFLDFVKKAVSDYIAIFQAFNHFCDISSTCGVVIVDIYSNKKETSDFHGTVSLDPANMLQQK